MLEASRSGDTNDLRDLILREGNCEERDGFEMTPLMVACQYGHADCVKLLLEAKADIRALDLNQRSALHFASRHDASLAKMLLDAGADPDAMDVMKSTPLHEASTHARPDVSKLLLESGASPDVKNLFGRTPRTARDTPQNSFRSGNSGGATQMGGETSGGCCLIM